MRGALRIKEIIKKYAEQEFIKHGFKLETQSGLWIFTREKDGRTQEAIFQKSNYQQGIRLYLQNRGYYEKQDIWILKYLGMPLSWITYDDEKQFIEIIKELTSIFAEHGEEEFDKLTKSQPEMRNLTENEHKEVLQDTYQKAEIFRSKYGLDWNGNLKKQIKLVGDIIQSEKSKDWKQEKQLIIYAIAYVGEKIIRDHGGEWIWNQACKCALIQGFHNLNEEAQFTPRSIECFWSTSNEEFLESITEGFKLKY